MKNIEICAEGISEYLDFVTDKYPNGQYNPEGAINLDVIFSD